MVPDLLTAPASAATEWDRQDRQLPRWRGVACQQFPADLWRYAELCFELRPPFVIEVGAADGGTALFLADVLAVIGTGEIIAVDVERVPARHPQLTILRGDSVSAPVVGEIYRRAAGRRGIVLLDGDHASVQVDRELGVYADLADYLIVEDTILRWLRDGADGPHLALETWLPRHREFRVDPDPVPGPTQHPGGWLKRIHAE